MRLRHIILCLLMMVFFTTIQGFASPCNNREVLSADLQPYKYNGKELDKMHGLNTYDYGARQYYSILGRWDRVDPLAEKYYPYSPYAYCNNNPIKYFDLDGKDYDFYYDGKSFTISATYYTDECSEESASKAVAFWNGLNGQYTMDGLPVNFALNVTVISSEEIPEGVKTDSFIKGKANVTLSGNTYMLSDIILNLNIIWRKKRNEDSCYNINDYLHS